MRIISGPNRYRGWHQVDDIGVPFGGIMDVFDSRHQNSRRLRRLHTRRGARWVLQIPLSVHEYGQGDPRSEIFPRR